MGGTRHGEQIGREGRARAATIASACNGLRDERGYTIVSTVTDARLNDTQAVTNQTCSEVQRLVEAAAGGDRDRSERADVEPCAVD